MNESQMCSICKKRIASVFITKMDEKGNAVNQGICLVCAKNMGLPQVDQFLSKMGISDDDLEGINDEMTSVMQSFEDGEMSDILPSADDTSIVEEETPSKTNAPNFFDFLRNMGAQGQMAPLRRPDDPGELKKGEKSKTESKNAADGKSGKPKLKFLSTYGTNLNDKAAGGLIDTVVGREREVDRVIQILNRRTKNNPVLVGEPGVGKTAIAEALALRIVDGTIPYKLRNMQVYMLDLTAMVAGTQFRGQFESRMKGVLDEVKKCGNIILVIDELHNIMGAGEAEGSMNAANILKPALSRGEIQVVGATTLKEYRKHIEKDGALERRFQPVYVEEPTIEDTVEILKGIRPHYENYHKVRISDEIIEDAVRMAERYITDRFLPDKAIDVIDEAASRANLNNTVLCKIGQLREELEANLKGQEQLSDAELYNEADEETRLDKYKELAELRSRQVVIEKELEELQKKEYVNIVFDDIAGVIENWTGIPVQTVTRDEADRLLHLESRLAGKVIGQDKAVVSVSKAIRRNRSGFRKRFKPSSFIFVGPTGVGKTELVKQLTLELFGTLDALVRLDMSEYMEKHTVSKLIGSPPGYVGYDEAGQLTEKIRRRPYSVILLDEIEKAHEDVFNMLLQILDDGRLTDSQGRTVNFENTVIIMTSNAGTSLKNASIGFSDNKNTANEDAAKDALKQIFRPEFLNRVDDIIVFNSLDSESMIKITSLMLDEVISQCIEKGLSIDIDDEVVAYLSKEGFDEKYGARPLRRLIQKCIEDELAEMYLRGKIKAGDHINVVMCDGNVSFTL